MWGNAERMTWRKSEKYKGLEFYKSAIADISIDSTADQNQHNCNCL